MNAFGGRGIFFSFSGALGSAALDGQHAGASRDNRSTGKSEPPHIPNGESDVGVLLGTTKEPPKIELLDVSSRPGILDKVELLPVWIGVGRFSVFLEAETILFPDRLRLCPPGDIPSLPIRPGYLALVLYTDGEIVSAPGWFDSRKSASCAGQIELLGDRRSSRGGNGWLTNKPISLKDSPPLGLPMSGRYKLDESCGVKNCIEEFSGEFVEELASE